MSKAAAIAEPWRAIRNGVWVMWCKPSFPGVATRNERSARSTKVIMPTNRTLTLLEAGAAWTDFPKPVHAAATPPSVTRLTNERRFMLCSYFGGLSIGAVKHQRSPSAESTAVLLYCVALDCAEGLLSRDALRHLAMEAD